MKTLIVSFWEICLGNIPEGTFTHKTIPAAEAKQLIDSSRVSSKVIGVSAEDLFLPDNYVRNNHQGLREVLKATFDISLALEDFHSATATNVEMESDEEGEYQFVHPLDLFEIGPDVSLLVINCNYELGDFDDMIIPYQLDAEAEYEEQETRFGFRIAPESVTFHLFEV